MTNRNPRSATALRLRNAPRKQSAAELAEIHKVRRLCGLPPLRATRRMCLCCGETFNSEYIGHRMCPPCRYYSPGEGLL